MNKGYDYSLFLKIFLGLNVSSEKSSVYLSWELRTSAHSILKSLVFEACLLTLLIYISLQMNCGNTFFTFVNQTRQKKVVTGYYPGPYFWFKGGSKVIRLPSYPHCIGFPLLKHSLVFFHRNLVFHCGLNSFVCIPSTKHVMPTLRSRVICPSRCPNFGRELKKVE